MLFNDVGISFGQVKHSFFSPSPVPVLLFGVPCVRHFLGTPLGHLGSPGKEGARWLAVVHMAGPISERASPALASTDLCAQDIKTTKGVTIFFTSRKSQGLEKSVPTLPGSCKGHFFRLQASRKVLWELLLLVIQRSVRVGGCSHLWQRASLWERGGRKRLAKRK